MFENIKDPAVRDYLMRRKQKEDELAQAQSTQTMVDYGDVAANVLKGLNTPQRVMYRNRLDALGTAPKTEEFETKTVDIKGGPLAREAVAAKQKELAGLDTDLTRNMAIVDRDKAQQDQAARRDPTSQESMFARNYLAQVAPSAAQMGNFDQLSAEQIEKIAPGLAAKFNAERSDALRRAEMGQRASEFDRNMALQDRELEQRRREAEMKDARDREQIRASQAKVEDKPAPGQKKVDEAYAQDYLAWTAGGKETAETNLNQLKALREDLASEGKSGALGSVGSRIQGSLPDVVNTDTAIQRRDMAQGATISGLKAALGSAFTQKEGELLRELSYNPKLPPDENLKRVDKLIKQIESGIVNQNAQQAQFESTGTLKGWQGTRSAPASSGKIVAKKQYSPSRDQTRIQYSDGTEEIVSGKR